MDIKSIDFKPWLERARNKCDINNLNYELQEYVNHLVQTQGVQQYIQFEKLQKEMNAHHK